MVGADAGEPLPLATCYDFCASPKSCRLVETDAGTKMMECVEVALCEGRRPAGWCPPVRLERSIIGQYFAEAAHLEASSVVAFRQLREELSLHGAPRRLIRAAERARRDEERHARVVTALARHNGAMVPSVVVSASSTRSIVAIAEDNAVEGCVRETYGAFVKLWQAKHARRPELRAIFSKIARDEIRHAGLSRRIEQWTNARLTHQNRMEIAMRKQNALTELAGHARVTPNAQLVREVGMPDPTAAAALVRGVDALLEA